MKGAFGGGIDNAGGELLSWMIRSTDFRGNVASVGLAASPQLQLQVMPFILRGVCLLGINSSATPRPLRLKVWERLATDLRPRHLDTLCPRELPFAELAGAFQAYLDGRVTGRTLVRVA